MEKFRTTFNISKSKSEIDHRCKLISLGSCFSENIGDKLSYYKFKVEINPFGILYNPESIANSLDMLLAQQEFNTHDLFEYKGQWNSFYHHSRFSNANKETCLNQINTAIQKATKVLNEADFLLITFGTSWVYEYKSTNKIVSNCHKLPEKEFKRHKLSVKVIVDRYLNLIEKLKKRNPNLNIVFTVSPIRHLKDGADHNQLSKATLILAVHELVNQFSNVYYFPSYEIMMDDLRDYRFYNEDMVHPSPQAINYIWEKFSETYISNTTVKLMVAIEKIKQAVNHRSFQPESNAHQNFLNATFSKIIEIEQENPDIDFKVEKTLLKEQIREV